MSRQGRWARGVACILLAGALAAGSGCLPHFLNRVDAPPACVADVCKDLPKPCRDHVYIFLVHGLDLGDCSNLKGVCDYVQGLGFHRTYYGYCYHAFHFNKEIRRLACEDPKAQFVLVGFSHGAHTVRSMAQKAKSRGICVSLLVYVDGHALANPSCDGPSPACRVVNVISGSCLLSGAPLPGAYNVCLPGAFHCCAPSHQAFLELLAGELAGVAGTVPYTPPPEPARPPELEEAPTPRPVRPDATTRRDEWDFLKPVAKLRKSPAQPAGEPEPATVPKVEQGPALTSNR